MGVGVSLIRLPTLGLFLSQWAASSSLDVRICTWSYCILLRHVWLMSLGDLSFSWGRQGHVDLGKRTDGGRDERNEERESFGKGLHMKEEKTYFYKEKNYL